MEPPAKDTTNEVKAETYEAMAVVNRSFEQIMSALYQLESKGVLEEDYAYNQQIAMREMLARINCHILASVSDRELDDRSHYSRMRASQEKRRKKRSSRVSSS